MKQWFIFLVSTAAVALFSNCSNGFRATPAIIDQGSSLDVTPPVPLPEPSPTPIPSSSIFKVSSLAFAPPNLEPGSLFNYDFSIEYSGPSLSDDYQVFMHLVGENSNQAWFDQALMPILTDNPVFSQSSKWQGRFRLKGSLVVSSELSGNYKVLVGIHDAKSTAASSNIRLSAETGVSEIFGTGAIGYRYEIGRLKIVKPATEPRAPLGRVMPMGDSITYGCCDNVGGYRVPLAEKLKASGFAFNFVGSVTWDPPYQHEGHGGWCVSDPQGQCTGGLQQGVENQRWLENSSPDTVLLMAGTNDVWQVSNGDAQAEAEKISTRQMTLINTILQRRPGVQIFVATIPPISGYDPARLIVQATNVKLKAKVQALNSAKVRVVDIHAAFENPDGSLRADTSSFFSDGTHPTQQGYELMAQKWFEALR